MQGFRDSGCRFQRLGEFYFKGFREFCVWGHREEKHVFESQANQCVNATISLENVSENLMCIVSCADNGALPRVCCPPRASAMVEPLCSVASSFHYSKPMSGLSRTVL